MLKFFTRNNKEFIHNYLLINNEVYLFYFDGHKKVVYSALCLRSTKKVLFEKCQKIQLN